MNKILIIRGQKVMIDRDLAELYGVTTFRLNEQVKRNMKRFPKDFMFQLTAKEKREVIANCDHLKSLKYSPHLPYAFTEHDAVMLASVLNSDRAINVNLQIVRVYSMMKEMIMSHKDILLQLEKLEGKVAGNTQEIKVIFTYLKQLLNPPEQVRRRIGFRRSEEDNS